MFRDREKALQELQQLLQEEEDTDEEVEEYDEDTEEYAQDEYEDAEEEEEEDAPLLSPRAYNTDTTDTDLESYSSNIYDAPKKRTGAALWLSLATAAVLLALSWYLAKQGGLL